MDESSILRIKKNVNRKSFHPTSIAAFACSSYQHKLLQKLLHIMQKLKWLLPLALFIGVFFVACHEDDPFQTSKMVDVAFTGRIIAENGEPIAGAFVEAGDESAISDQNGVFRLKSNRMAADHAIVSVHKSGYFDLSRAYIVQDKAVQTVSIQLLTKTLSGSVSATAGGLVNVQGGAKLDFPAGAITDENGQAYSGTVNVFARYLDPSKPEIAINMPGNLTAINAAGELRSLASFGMIGVELASPGGQKLKIASGQQVEIRIPIDPGIVAAAPAEIPLWHYEASIAYWKEEGLAQKVGNEYVGKVSHFSWWNYDATYPSILASGKVYFNDLQHPAADVQVWIGPENQGIGWGCGHGATDIDGSYSGAIPADMPLKITILTWDPGCGMATLYTANIGPFSSDVIIPDIIISNVTVQGLELSGRLLDCNGNAVVNGYAKITLAGLNPIVAYTNANGEFQQLYTTCGAIPQTGEAIGYDMDNLTESTVQNFAINSGTVNLGDLTVCTALSEYIQYTLDGELTTLTGPSGWCLQDSFPNTGYLTSIGAQSNVKSINIGFNSPAIQTGIFPITQLSVTSNFDFSLQQSNLNTTVTGAATNVSDFIIGTFDGTILDFVGTSHTISGSYRVKRDW